MTENYSAGAMMRGGDMRSRIVSMSLLAAFAAVAIKGGVVSLNAPETKTLRGTPTFEAPVRRADIVDRNGVLLATSMTVYSLFADPRAIGDGALIARELKSVLPDLDVEKITRRLSNSDRAFAWIERGLTPNQRDAVFNLGLEGLGFREESRRAYPRGTLAGHVLGYAGSDGDGLAGMEYALNDRLEAGGDPVELSINANVQFSLEAELAAAIGSYEAEAAAGIVMDAGNGQVLGMASWPPLDPNRATKLSRNDPALLNRATGAVYELGSVFKPLTIAGAIDAGVVSPRDAFDVRKPLRISGEEIADTHPIKGRATPSLIVSESSNIGTVKVAQKLGSRRQQELFSGLGLFSSADIELTGSASPILPAVFDELTLATSSYGHGIAVSPIAFTEAFSALANSGERVVPTLLREPERPRQPRRVMSAPTAAIVTKMLREAVVNGTGTRAEVGGYRVAGKTGTAEKPINGAYAEDINICSFAALFPADRPEYVVLIVLDSPKAGANRGRTAAWNAAPTTGRVIERIAPILGVLPKFDEPVQSFPAARSVSEQRSEL